jgi:hypothetical protein
MSGYVKLFSGILHSSLWLECMATRITWITLLALADADGFVSISKPALAAAARVSMDEVDVAIQYFTSPDPFSRTPDDDGRRLIKVDGGFRIVNYEKYRNMLSVAAKRERDRERQRKYRQGKVDAVVSHDVTPRHALSHQAEAEAEALPPPTPSSRGGKPKPVASARRKPSKVAPFSDDVVFVVNTLLPQWPTNDPEDGRKIESRRSELSKRVESILASDGVDPDMLVAIGERYIRSKRKRFKAAQYYFGKGKEGDPPPYIADLQDLMTEIARAASA